MDAPLNSRAALLQVLLSGPGYGTELAARVKERSLGAIVLLQGSLYPMLRAFETEGFVKAKRVDRSEDQRGGRQLIIYTMTKAGKEQALRDRTILATMIEAQPVPEKRSASVSGETASA